jgi:hypothetical protein
MLRKGRVYIWGMGTRGVKVKCRTGKWNGAGLWVAVLLGECFRPLGYQRGYYGGKVRGEIVGFFGGFEGAKPVRISDHLNHLNHLSGPGRVSTRNSGEKKLSAFRDLLRKSTVNARPPETLTLMGSGVTPNPQARTGNQSQY